MNTIVNNSTIKLNEIAISLINASHTQQVYRSSIKMICLMDELLNNQFKNSLEISLSTFKYISFQKNETIDSFNINIEEIVSIENDSFVERKSDSFRTLAFLLFDIIILINDSIENSKITESFFGNFVEAFNKLFIFEKIYLQSDISIKTLQKIVID